MKKLIRAVVIIQVTLLVIALRHSLVHDFVDISPWGVLEICLASNLIFVVIRDACEDASTEFVVSFCAWCFGACFSVWLCYQTTYLQGFSHWCMPAIALLWALWLFVSSDSESSLENDNPWTAVPMALFAMLSILGYWSIIGFVGAVIGAIVMNVGALWLAEKMTASAGELRATAERVG